MIRAADSSLAAPRGFAGAALSIFRRLFGALPGTSLWPAPWCAAQGGAAQGGAPQSSARPRVPAHLRIPIASLVSIKREASLHAQCMSRSPCLECGAESAQQAQTQCAVSGDKDDCHGCRLWPAL